MIAVVTSLASVVRSRMALQIGILALRHPRPIQGREQGAVIEVAEGGGLDRHYERRAA